MDRLFRLDDPVLLNWIAALSEERIPMPWPISDEPDEYEDGWHFSTNPTYSLTSNSTWYSRKVRGQIQNQSATAVVIEPYAVTIERYVSERLGVS